MFFEPILIAFFIIGIGFIFEKKIGFDQQSLSNLLIYIAYPSLIFYSLYTQELIFDEFFAFGTAAFSVFILSAISSLIIFRSIGYKGYGAVLPAIFMNSAYLGFPIVLFALGEVALQKAVIFDFFNTLIFFTLGVFFVQSEGSKMDRFLGIFKLPILYGVVIALALNIANFTLPSFLEESFRLVGLSTLPLALVALGGRLASLRIKTFKIPIIAVLNRFIIGGLTGFAVAYFLNLSGVVASVIMLISVMPPAINTFVMNEKFGNDPDNAASAVVLGTLLSIIPISIVLAFFI